jgi:hypothetical protein
LLAEPGVPAGAEQSGGTVACGAAAARAELTRGWAELASAELA